MYHKQQQPLAKSNKNYLHREKSADLKTKKYVLNTN